MSRVFEEEKEKLLEWATAKLERERSRKQLLRLFVFALTGDFAAIAMGLFAPRPAADATSFAINIEGKIALYLAGVPFVCGFLIAFSLSKLAYGNDSSRMLNKGSFLSRYEDHIKNENRRNHFLACAAVGGLNAIVFWFAVSWWR